MLNQEGEEGLESEACVVKRLKFEEFKKSKQKSDNLNGWNARSGKKKSEGRSERKEDSGVHTGCVQKGHIAEEPLEFEGKRVETTVWRIYQTSKCKKPPSITKREKCKNLKAY